MAFAGLKRLLGVRIDPAQPRMAVVFCPKPAETGPCAVAWAYRLLAPNFKGGQYLKIFVDSTGGSLAEHVKGEDVDIVPRRAVVFGHSSEESEGLIARGSTIGSEWWGTWGRPVLFVLHACHGAQLLGRKDWSDRFTSWISYNDKIRVTMAEDLDHHWEELYAGMLSALAAAHSPEQALVAVQLAYLKKLNELMDDPTIPGSELMKSNLLKAMSSLKQSP